MIPEDSEMTPVTYPPKVQLRTAPDTDGLTGDQKRKRWRPSPPRAPPASLEDAAELPLASANVFSKLLFSWVTPLLFVGFRRHLQATDLWKMDDTRQVNKLADSFTANLERRAERAREWNDSLSVRTPPVIQRWLWAVKAATRQWPTAGTADQSHDTYQARVAAFETQWRQDTGRKQPSLAGALSDTFPGFWYVAIWRMLSDGMLVVQPLVVQQLIRFNQASHEAHENHTAAPSVGRGIGLAIGLFCLLQFSSVCLEQYNFRAKQYGVLARGAMVQALYERVFRLSIPARASNSDGKLTTHLSADITRVDSAVHLFHAAWTSAIRLGVVLILLCLQIGPSGLVGFLVFLFLAPVQTMILKFGLRMRGKSMVFTELRSNLLQQVLGSMSIVKMFTYEVPYLKRLTGLRAGELAGIRFLHLTRSGAESFALSLPTMASVVAFVMYTSVQPAFDPAVIFPAIMYFNSFQGSLMIIPRSLSMTMDAYNALKRLAPVFNAEVKDDGLTIVSTLDVAIRTAQASFRWVSGPPDQPISAGGGGSNGENDASTHNSGFTLADINMEIPRGRLVAVVGPVGSGKSSLMLGLLGEMTRIAGIVQFSSRPAYCAQSAWIQNATVRDNVVFGQPFDETRYWSCIKDACLIPDLEILADGDMTEIGEKGINLSGGQKQRINIARALYSNADIVIFDDPLSAVDAQVGKMLFQNAIQGLVRSGKTVVLVTHALHFLPEVDYVYTLKNGRIAEEGTYDDLMNNGREFRVLMDQFGGFHGKEADHSTVPTAPEDNVDAETEAEADITDPLSSDHKQVAAWDTSKIAGTGTAKGRLMVAEERRTGAMGWRVYGAYVRAGGFVWFLPAVVCAACMQGAQVMSNVWLTYWQEDKFMRLGGFYQGLYAMLGGATAIFTLLSGTAMTILSINASKSLFKDAAQQVMFSPMRFFDTTPTGRILGIFGKDIDAIDNELPELMRLLVLLVAMLCGAVIISSIHFPYYVLIVAGVGVGYGSLALFFRRSSREIQRLNSIFRSSLYAHFAETLSGVATIRAYGETHRFNVLNRKLVDDQNRAYLLTAANESWLAIQLNNLGSVLVLSIALMCATQGRSTGASQIALVLTYMSSATGTLAGLSVIAVELENTMNAVERVLYLADGHLPREAPYLIQATFPGETWPSGGSIKFDNVFLSYRPGLPAVLKGISVEINAGERVGIIGRTGAGKTSITVALYRLAELTSGTISIDGVDIASLGLKTLRSSIAIIPQEPVLFSGTLRSNLDPFDSFCDAQLYDALERACLSHTNAGSEGDDTSINQKINGSVSPENGDSSQRFTLDMVIEDGGSNLSIGQRSLVSLARALVKDSRIMVLDEATASVDLATDAKIQTAIRNERRRSPKTLLCIAHRLRTVIGWDKIIVMDAGQLQDFASPLELFDKEDSIFRGMCDRSSITRNEILRAQQENDYTLGHANDILREPAECGG